MVFSKDVKSPVATSLSTVSTDAGEREQEDPSLTQSSPSRRLVSHSSSPTSPPHNAHNNAWEAELETHLLEEMRQVTQGYSLLLAQAAMTALQDRLKDGTPKPSHQEVFTQIVNILEQLVGQLENFHSTDKSPTVSQRNAQRDIARLITRVPAALIATMQVSRESDFPPP